jgi:hypothetical protein
MVGRAALLRRRGRAAARPYLEMRLHLLLKCSSPQDLPQQTGNKPVTLTLKLAWTGLVGRLNNHRCDKNLTTDFRITRMPGKIMENR